MNMKTIKGRIIIESGMAVKKDEGGIIIPEKARQVRSKIGKVIAVAPYPVGTRVKLWRGGTIGGKKKVTISQGRHDQDLALLGEYVLLSEGQLFMGQDKKMYVAGKIEHVLATVDEPDKMKLVSDGPPRCPRCKSRGEGNLLLDDKGYCNNCNRNEAGQHRSDHDHRKVSDDASDHMSGRTSREATQKAQGLATENKIISYAGQTKHGALKTKK